MGTQGVLSIVKGGEVLCKVVCGCRGDKIKDLAEYLRSNKGVTKASEVYKLAGEYEVGCEDCLVVMSEKGTGYYDIEFGHPVGDDNDLFIAYADTYFRPSWNPRWIRGTADYVEIVKRES